MMGQTISYMEMILSEFLVRIYEYSRFHTLHKYNMYQNICMNTFYAKPISYHEQNNFFNPNDSS